MTQVSLYREAWTAFKRHAHELMPWILGFSVLSALCNFYSFRDEVRALQVLLPHLWDQVNAGNIPDLVPDIQETQVSKLADFCGDIIEFVGLYYFSVLYLKQEPAYAASPRPDLSPSGFVIWLYNMLKAIACVAACGLLVAALGLGVDFLGHLFGADVNTVVYIVAVMAMLVLMYAAVKFFLVGPLALSQIKSPVKTSWQLSKGQWWRLAWNYLGLGWTIFLIFLAAFLVLSIILYFTVALDSVIFIGVMSLLSALFTMTNMAILAVYFCVSCRVLVEEQGLPAQGESGSII